MRRGRSHPHILRLALGAILLAGPVLAVACTSSPGDSGAGGVTGGSADAGVVSVTHPDAAPLPGESACTVTTTTNIPEPDFNHIAVCTPLTYATNPPSGGNHWPIWVAYKKYTEPVPREMYVHNEEHGAIILAYRCPDDCPDVVAALSSVFDGMADPLCLSAPGPAARVVLTPDPMLDTPIAAASWGDTYTATCIDVPSLRAFADAHYGQGREPLCADGVDPIAMPLCPGMGTGGSPPADAGDAGEGG